MRISGKIGGNRQGASGFTLVELMVVLVISAILGFSVITIFTAPLAKVKSAAFSLRGDFNLARSEAVSRNTEVLVDFVFNSDSTYVDDTGTLDGYRICVDGATGTPDNNCGDADDTSIKDALMHYAVQFYDTTGGAITGGPTATSGGDSLVSNNGITFSTDYVKMQSDGSSDLAGAVVVYVPADGSPPTEMLATPFEVAVALSGKVSVRRWRNSVWSTK